MVRTLCSLIIATAVSGIPTVRLTAAAASTPFRLDASGAVVIPVQINGRRTYQLVVDTGSSRSAVSRRLAVEAGAPVVAKAAVVSIGQETSRLVVRLDRVEAGPAARPDILASVIPDEELQALAPGVDGVLGQDFLATFDYTIDYRKRTLSWEADPAPLKSADHGSSCAPKKDGTWWKSLRARDASVRFDFVPDSGAAVMVLYERDGHLPVQIGRGRRPVDVAGLSGGRRAVLSTLTELADWRVDPS